MNFIQKRQIDPSGWCGDLGIKTSPGDFEAVTAISKGLKNSIPCGLARAKKKDIDACYESLKYAKDGNFRNRLY